MEQPQNDFDGLFDDLLLFESEDHPNVINDIQLGGDILWNDDDQNLIFSLSQLNNDNSLDSQTIDGDVSAELFRILSDTQQDTIAIVNNEQLIQNPDVTNTPTPQQAAGSENGIHYLMYPHIFNFIDGVMSVQQQPKANKRLRYQSDGSRFLPDSRYHPMTINLPNLQSVLLGPNHVLGIVTTLATTANNPKGQTYIHANDITCHEPGAIKIAYGCVFNPIDPTREILTSKKQFKRFAINYKKCDEYTFDLTPFDALTMFGPTEKYAGTDNRNVGNAAKGKDFKREYELLSYKIIFQLALKENNVVYISNITCETDIVVEQAISRNSGKRSASASIENLSEDDSSLDTQVSNSSKRSKSSTPPVIGHPVTRVSNNTTETNIDHAHDLA